MAGHLFLRFHTLNPLHEKHQLPESHKNVTHMRVVASLLLKRHRIQR
jgi:hypothetical protein